MSSAIVASSTSDFIDAFQTILTANYGVVLTFAAGILVWFIAKKWIFGGARKV